MCSMRPLHEDDLIRLLCYLALSDPDERKCLLQRRQIVPRRRGLVDVLRYWGGLWPLAGQIRAQARRVRGMRTAPESEWEKLDTIYYANGQHGVSKVDFLRQVVRDMLGDDGRHPIPVHRTKTSVWNLTLPSVAPLWYEAMAIGVLRCFACCDAA